MSEELCPCCGGSEVVEWMLHYGVDFTITPYGMRQEQCTFCATKKEPLSRSLGAIHDVPDRLIRCLMN